MIPASIGEIQRGYREKKWSVTQVTKACLSRVEKLDGRIKAFLTVVSDRALERAEELDRELAKDQKVLDQKPLFGIPYAAKDLFSTKGIRTTTGSKVLENYLPAYDATVIGRLDESGAVLIGKTNQDAWAHGTSGENSDFFPTHNPWDLNCVPGGSSSGSAAAVASRMVPFALGTDTGGSIRCPASFCGVTGLKPTYGRVSRYGVIAMASSLDSVGHISLSVEDAARVLTVTAGRDPHDATTPEREVPSYLKGLDNPIGGLKVGVPKEYLSQGVLPEVRLIVEKALAKLEELGAKAVEVSLPHTSEALAVYYIVQPAEVSSNLARYDGIRFGNGRERFGKEAKRRIMLGTYILSAGYYEAYYRKAMQVRTLICQDFQEVFGGVDVLIGPVMPHGAFRLEEKVEDPLSLYLEDVLTVPVNLAGLPALAVPCGFEEKGLPVGLQIIGPQFSEDLLFRVGHAYQKVTDWHLKLPPMATNS